MKTLRNVWSMMVVFLLSGGFLIGCSNDSDTTTPKRPVVFVHGFSGSASQFESQAQRFIINGYPAANLAAYEHNTGTGAPSPDNQIDGLDEVIDTVLAQTGQKNVDLICHSRGTRVCSSYLNSSAGRAAKVAHYVAVDAGGGLPTGGVPTLALWGDLSVYEEGNPARSITGATHIMDTTQAHIELATSAASFARMYKFFNDADASRSDIVSESGANVTIAGRALYFPENVGAPGTLKIYELNRNTGFRISDTPSFSQTIVDDGKWGSFSIKKDVAYEFAFEHSGGGKHHFYREPFTRSNYFARLLTSRPGSGLGVILTKSDNHTDILVSRDKEIWGDQGVNNDILIIDGINAATTQVAYRAKRLSGLFLLDWGADKGSILTTPDQVTDLSTPISIFHSQAFMSGLDLYMPAALTPNRTIACWLIPRSGNGKTQWVNVPNWASSDIRVTVNFRDCVY
ncbi:MAG: hypothetical protein JW925_12475 [Syntrophaceae bacterium]|nr:hypothetical protein [Syntrophaceae bacterium]